MQAVRKPAMLPLTAALNAISEISPLLSGATAESAPTYVPTAEMLPNPQHA